MLNNNLQKSSETIFLNEKRICYQNGTSINKHLNDTGAWILQLNFLFLLKNLISYWQKNYKQ
jgi:hypothetical protein